MFNSIENLQIISSFNRCAKPTNKITNRSSHVFIIRLNGSVLYNINGVDMLSKKGDIGFFPKGSTYSYKALSDDTTYTSINFEADFQGSLQPVIYSLDNFYDAEYIGSNFTKMWNFGNPSEKHKCLSLFYSLLSYLSSLENADYGEKKKFKIIEPAEKYLTEHIYDCSLKTDTLHRLCGISNTYFRQIFISKFGINPQDYIISKRLSHAKTIIDSGDFNSIREVALSVGYNDPLYFSKAFKKMFGISPSDINKNS